MTFTDDMTLREARDELRTLVTAGAECPCCRQTARVYERPMTAVAARAVIALRRAHGRDFGHMPTVTRKYLADVNGQGGYVVLAQHWGLIEEERRVRGDGGRAGYWRITDRGEAFVLGHAAVPRIARLYAGRCLGLSGQEITVRQVLGEHFDLADLLGPQPAPDAAPEPLFGASADVSSTPYGRDMAA